MNLSTKRQSFKAAKCNEFTAYGQVLVAEQPVSSTGHKHTNEDHPVIIVQMTGLSHNFNVYCKYIHHIYTISQKSTSF